MSAAQTAAEQDELGDQRAPGFPDVAGEDSELLWVDPRELVIGDNVRTEVALDKGFVADIAERGVRQPILVRREGSGRLVVRTGQPAGAGRDRGRSGPGPGPGRG